MRAYKTVRNKGNKSNPGFTSTETTMNELIEEAINTVVQEAVKHFNTTKTRVRDPEEDARFFWNDEELNMFLQQIKYPDRVWVSTITDDKTGKFYAYRVGRVIALKDDVKKY